MKVETSKTLRIALTFLFIGLLIGGSGVYIFASSSPSTFYLSGGIYPSAYSYTIWKESSTYYAKNAYGQIPSWGSDTNDTTIVQTAINLTSDGVIFLKDMPFPTGITHKDNVMVLVHYKGIIEYRGNFGHYHANGTSKWSNRQPVFRFICNSNYTKPYLVWIDKDGHDIAWINAHYMGGEGVHSHVSIETVKADMATVISRLSISYGVNKSEILFANSYLRLSQDNKFYFGYVYGNASDKYIHWDGDKLVVTDVYIRWGRPYKLTNSTGGTKAIHHTYEGSTQASPSNGDRFWTEFIVKGGERHIYIGSRGDTDCGKFDVYVWDTLLGSATLVSSGHNDYSASPSNKNRDITVDAGTFTRGRHVVELRVNGKDASSSDYKLSITGISISGEA